MRKPIGYLMDALGHQFADVGLLERALTHRSASGRNNERLEFLGDALLGYIMAEELYRQFQHENEGRLSRLRSTLVKREALAELARALDLGAFLSLGSGELRSGGQNRDSILADAFEALIAAVYLDAGIDRVRELLLSLFQDKLKHVHEAPLKDPKTRLQEYLQGQRRMIPCYSVVAVNGDQHSQQFTVRCLLEDGGEETLGEGKSRRKAEQAAARKQLQAFGIHD